MTVSNTTGQSGPFYPNGVTTVFAFAFKALFDSDVQVVSSSDGIETVVSSALYDVTRDDDEGGNVIFTDPPGVGVALYIRLNPSFAQNTEFENQGAFLPEVLTSALDQAAQRDIYLLSKVGRTVVSPLGEDGLTLPSAANRAGKGLAFDADGQPVVADFLEIDPTLALAAAGIFSTIALGLAATTSGQDFLVEASGDDVLATLYSNVNGAAIDTGKDLPSYAAVFAAIGTGTVVTPSRWTDSEAAVLQPGGYYTTSPLARTLYRTDATSLTITAYTSMYDQFPTVAGIGVLSNGAWVGQVTSSALGVFSGTVTLPSGSKIVQLVNGSTSKQSGGSLKGTYLKSVTANAPILQMRPRPAGRVVFLGDSITVGGNATYPAQASFIARLRGVTADSIVAEGYGYNTFMEQAGTTGLRNALVASLVALGAEKIVIALGTNDYALATTSPTLFQAAYAAFLDAIHSAMPTVPVFAVSPIIRGDEVTAIAGSTIQAFRDAVANAATGRAWVTYVSGKAFMTAAFLDDGVHPTNTGHLKWAQGIAPSLGYIVPDVPIGTAALNAGPDEFGAVSVPSAGVLRYTKNLGGNDFTGGAYGGLRTGDLRYQIDMPTAVDLFIGFGSTPYDNSGYADMPKALHLTAGGSMNTYEAGSPGPAPAYTNWSAGNTTLGRFFVDRTGTTVTFKQGPDYASARTLLTYTGVSGSIGLDYSLANQGSSFDVTVLV